MKKLIIATAIAFLNIQGCTTSPTKKELSIIEQGCMADALVRPMITALINTTGLATDDEKRAVTLARAIIDPVCASPTTPIAYSVEQAVLSNIGEIQAIAVALTKRKGQ